jgi:cell division protein FtsB
MDDKKKIDNLELQNMILHSEIKKLKDTIITLQLKVNMLTLNDYGCSEDSE